MTSVVIIDDHELIRIATTSYLSSHDGIEVVGSADSGEAGVKLAKEMKPDVVITDIEMQGMDGIETTKRLKSALKNVKIIALSRHSKSPYPERILEAGACGYVDKGASPDLIIEAIERVMEGGKYISPDVANNLIFSQSPGAAQDNPFDKLTKREMQIALMLVEGHRPTNISEKLGLSVKTIFTHRSRIHIKLGISNDVELTNLAARFDLV